MKKSINPVVSIIVFLSVLSVVSSHAKAENGTAISKDGVPISYSISGQGGPVLIFVHGWSANSSFWKKQIPYFEKKYRVVTLDLAGHGKSGYQRIVYSVKSFGEDVAAVVRAIQLPKVILIGHSMSGPVIIAAGEIIPDNVEAFIGIDTLQDFEESYTPQQQEEYLKSFKEDFKKATDFFVRPMFAKGTDPKLIDEIIQTLSNASPEVGISAFEEMLKTSYRVNPPKIKAPVWCLNSDLWPTKPEINCKYVPEFHLRIMPGVGHFLMLESPDEFNKQLDEIISEIEKKK